MFKPTAVLQKLIVKYIALSFTMVTEYVMQARI